MLLCSLANSACGIHDPTTLGTKMAFGGPFRNHVS